MSPLLSVINPLTVIEYRPPKSKYEDVTCLQKVKTQKTKLRHKNQ